MDAQKTHWMASFSEDYPFKLIVTHSENGATDIYEGYRFFDKNVFVYPPETSFSTVRMSTGRPLCTRDCRSFRSCWSGSR